MLDPEKRERFRELREREQAGALADTDQAELHRLIEEIENAEAIYLNPATEKLRQEREAMDAQNQALQDLIQRKEALVERLQTFLAQVEAERKAINDEVARILSGRAGTPSGS
jgi:hypothetical protein